MRRTIFRYPVTTLAGSTLENIRNLQKRHTIEPDYRKKFVLSKIIAEILQPFTWMEERLWRERIKNFKLTSPPVFIIGFWRSGTTLLHNLLCQDPVSAYTTTFQTVFPNLVLTESWWLKPFVNRFLPVQRPYDNIRMDMDYPQEEDFGMMNMQPSTIYKFFIFPKEYDRIIDRELFTAQLPPDELAAWKEAYRCIIAKAVFNTGGSRYIGKNPCHLTRTALLREMFPGARFIFIHRHPYQVIESLYQFILTIFPGVQLQDIPQDFSREKVVMLYDRMMKAYYSDRDNIPGKDHITLRMDEFVRDIPANLRTIYHQFDLGDYAEISDRVEKFLSENPVPEHNSHAPEAETIRLVDQHASWIMQDLGYAPQKVSWPEK